MHVELADDAIYIVGAGASTAVGRGLLASAAAVRAGIAGFGEHPFMIDKHGEPMVVARAKWLDEDVSVEDRIAALGAESALEALAPALSKGLSADRNIIRGYWALSEENVPDVSRRQEVVSRIVSELQIGAFNSDIVAEGHAVGFLALANACADLRARKAHFCIVGAADSWISPKRLKAIDMAGRTHSVNYSWGFIPGEGAGCCLVTTGARAKQLGLVPLAEVLGVGIAHETKLMGTETVCIGEGLTEAFRQVLDSRYRVSHCYCDFNGETYRADEYGFTICRTSKYFEDSSRFTAAAECWGDVGAASGLVALTLPLSVWTRENLRCPVTLVWSSGASTPLRGAALLKQAAISN